MSRFLGLTSLVSALWWLTVLFPWASVRDQHSITDGLIGTLTGSEIGPVWSLFPAIVLLMTVIARYRSLSRLMAIVAGLSALAALIMLLGTNLVESGSVQSLVANSTGIASTSTVQLTLQFGYFGYIVMNVVTVLVLVATVFRRRAKQTTRSVKPEESSDSTSLWDEQGN